MDHERLNQVLSTLTKKGDQNVDCSHIQLGDEQVGLLVSAMENSPIPVKNLNLSSNNITDIGAATIAEFLADHHVDEVRLSENQITDSGAALFIPLFKSEDPHPASFELHGNPCSESMISRLYFLANAHGVTASVKEALLTKCAETVSFDGAKFADIDNRLLRFVFTDVDGLTTVDISNTDCRDMGISTVGGLLKDSKVKALLARKCVIGNTGVEGFIAASGLPTHPTLETIDFSDNMNILNNIASQIPNLVFNTNTTLTSWTFTGTSVSPEVVNVIENECALNKESAALKAAVVALRTHTPEAKEINLQWEKNIERAIELMWPYIRDSNIIEVLNVSNAGVGDVAMELLYNALSRNTSLRVLELANNNLTVAGITKLCSQIQRGVCNVQEINVANNSLGDDSAMAIISCIRANPKIRFLNIDVNPAVSADHVSEIGGLALINRSPAPLRPLLLNIEGNAKEFNVIDISASEASYNNDCVRMICHALMLNTSVRKANFSNNIIGDIGAVHIADLIASNQTITEIVVSNNSIGDRGVKKIGDALRVNSALKVLILDNNVFTADGVSAFPAMLRVNNSIATISLGNTRVPHDVASAIQHACDVNRESPEVKSVFYRLRDEDSTLDRIDLSEKKRQWALNDASMETLCAELRGHPFVKHLSLRGNSIGPVGCQYLANALADSQCGIMRLDLSRNAIGDTGFLELTKAFASNKALIDIDVRESGVTAMGCELAIPAMKQNDTILEIAVDETLHGRAVTELQRQLALNNAPIALKHMLLRVESGEAIEDIDLSAQKDRPFDDAACQLLCQGLLNKCSPRTVNLSDNKITSRSVPYITELIEASPTLAFFDVARNDIDVKGGDEFIACIERTAHIRAITVTGNDRVPLAKQERIAELLSMNFGSQELKNVLLQHARGERLDETLDFNSQSTGHLLTDQEAQALAQVLRSVTEVRGLDLGHNKIGDAGCIAVAAVLRMNHSMEALYMDRNIDIGVEAGDALFYALKINPQLHTLNLEGTQVPAGIIEDIESLLHVNQAHVMERIDMRAVTVEQVDDHVQFKCTNYHLSQRDKVDEEALARCKHTEHLLLE